MTYNYKVNKRLAVFDVEGIILPKRRYLFVQATKKLDFFKILNIILLGFLYEIGIYTLERALKGIYKFFEGISRRELYQTFKLLPIIPGVQEVFQKLRENGYQIALISSGLPDFLIKELARQLVADYAHGLKLEMVEGKITGAIKGDVIKRNGKAIVLEKILKKEKISKNHCIAVVDDRNNLSMFRFCAIIIGYNPDAVIAAKCDYAIKGNLRDIIPFFDSKVRILTNPYTRNDAFREFIHMGSFLIPLLCKFLNVNRYAIATLIVIIAIVYFFSELTRRVGINFPPFTTITNLAAMGDEKWGFASPPIFFALGIILSLTLYPTQTGFTAITILTLGDGTARIIGKKLGRIVLPYNKVKKLEGTLGGILVSSWASLLFVTPSKAIATSIFSLIVESLPLPINDNIIIPLIAGLVLTVIP